jgi:YfiH family protein
MEKTSAKVVTVSQWERIPYFVHGFGTREWKLSDFGKHPSLAKFKPIFLHQIHSAIIHVIRDFPEKERSGDAMLTDRPGLLLVIKTADCLPVLIADKDGRAVAAVHCGWRSTSQRLVQKVAENLKKNFGCDPSSLLVAFGPAIGSNCYEVGEDVRKEFKKNGLDGKVFRPHPQRKDKLLLDLRLSNRYQLREKGVMDSNLYTVDMCTHCESEFLSYRRDGVTKRRLYSFIGLISCG